MQRFSLRAVVLLASLMPAGGGTAQSYLDFEARDERFRVRSASMEPTLRQGSMVTARIGAMRPELPRRGEIILFRRNDEVGISRIIGLAGDTVAVAGGVVTVNGLTLARRGIAVPQGFTRRASRPNCFEESLDGRDYVVCETPGRTSPLRDTEPRLVPPGAVYVMGDNRDNAMDSRLPRFGFLSMGDFYGRNPRADSSFMPLR